MPVNVDYDQPLVKRVVGDTGVHVYMYKAQPGVFLDAFGREVPEALAAEAGYDVARLSLAKEKQARQKKALEQIEMELEGADNREHKVVKTKGLYKLVDLGLGRMMIMDDEDNQITALPIPKEQAEKLFEALTADSKEEEVADDEPLDMSKALKGDDAPPTTTRTKKAAN